jgi:ADP-ribosylglycohydrolase
MSAISEIQNKKVRELLYNTLMEVVTDDTQQTLVLLSNRLRTMKGSVNKEVLEEARLRVTNVLIGMYNKEDEK